MPRKTFISSFDVFDTCVVRTCGSPENFLQLLSFRVFQQMPPDNIRRLFIIDRIQAEQQACGNNPHADIYDIYKCLNFSHHSLLPQDKLANTEIELQKEVARPALHIRNKINNLREKGHKIIFISDMYLPESIIREVLITYGFLFPNDCLYVSNTVGLTKADGSLFEHIKKKEGINYRHWHHYGDNNFSDVKVPARLGISTHQVTNPYSSILNNWIRLPLICHYPYPSILAGISRSLILSSPDSERNHLILDLIAPFYCSFAYQILHHAKKNNIRRLYFCSRDTAQLYPVALQYTYLFPEIELRYLHISRDSLNNTSETILIDYFIQEGLACSDCKCAIVDSNTTGRTVYLINNLLNKYNYNQINRINIINYLTPNLHSYLHTYNPDHDYWLIDYTGSSSTFIIPILIEAIFSANTQHKTVTYLKENEKIIPVFKSSIDDDSLAQPTSMAIEEQQKKLLSQYVKLFISHNLYHHSESILYQIAIPTLQQFIQTPHKDILQALNGISFIHEGQEKPIIEFQHFFKLIRIRGRNTLWPRGTILYSLPNFGAKYYVKYRTRIISLL